MPSSQCGRRHRVGGAGDRPAHGVEVGVGMQIASCLPDPRRQRRRPPRGAFRDRPEPVGTVVDGVHARHHGQEHLRGADVAGRLLPADVLLAGLQGQAVGGGAVRIDAHADQSAGNAALESRTDRHESGVRTAEAERHPQSLGGTDHDVGPQLPRRGEQCQRKQIGGDHRQRASLVRLLDQRGDVAHPARRARVADEDPGDVALGESLLQVGHHQIDAQWLGSRLQDRQRLRVGIGVDEQCVCATLRDADRERHRLGRSSRLVQEGRARDGQRGEVLDHGLEVEKRLEATLGDLGLVRRVGRVPRGVLQDVPHDHGGRMSAVVAQADHAGQDRVLRGQVPQLGQRLDLAAARRQVQVLVPPDDVRHDSADEGVDVRVAEQPEHALFLGRVRPDVAVREVRAHADVHGGLEGSSMRGIRVQRPRS